MYTSKSNYLKTFGICLITLFSVLMVSNISYAGDTKVVCDSGCDYTSIQTAINNLSSGDTIIVCPGTYYENIDFDGKNITVISKGCPDQTIIDGGASGNVVTIDSGETSDAKLIGFTITNGGSSGIYIANYSNPAIEYCVITDNALNGIYINNYSDPTIKDCVSTDNDNAGIYITNYSDPTIEGTTRGDCQITYNGGGIGITSTSNPLIKNCDISHNDSTGIGITYTSDPTIQNCDITYNISNSSGGGIKASSGCDLTVTGCVISNNEAGYGYLSGDGGGVNLYSSNSTFTNCDIKNNVSDANGGGIYELGGSDSEFTNCEISGNESKNGGGVHLTNGADVTFEKCTISNNTIEPLYTSWGGGGIYSTKSSPTFINCNIVDNTITGSTGGNGGGGYFLTSENYNNTFTFTNCTISGNSSNQDGGGLAFRMNATQTESYLKNCIIYGNTATSDGDDIDIYSTYNVINIDYSAIDSTKIDGSWDGSDNLDGYDPDFVDAVNGDYHIESTSPCKDAGTSTGAPSDDIDGNSRPYNTYYDMGSDEYTP